MRQIIVFITLLTSLASFCYCMYIFYDLMGFKTPKMNVYLYSLLISLWMMFWFFMSVRGWWVIFDKIYPKAFAKDNNLS